MLPKYRSKMTNQTHLARSVQYVVQYPRRLSYICVQLSLKFQLIELKVYRFSCFPKYFMAA